jgi:hypothetical protein
MRKKNSHNIMFFSMADKVIKLSAMLLSYCQFYTLKPATSARPQTLADTLKNNKKIT